MLKWALLCGKHAQMGSALWQACSNGLCFVASMLKWALHCGKHVHTCLVIIMDLAYWKLFFPIVMRPFATLKTLLNGQILPLFNT